MVLPREWDAATYHRVSDPQFTWGKRVLARLPLTGEETVIDAGCGSGRLTAELAGRLPKGHVLAVDRSMNMVDQARTNLTPFGDRVEVRCVDLAEFVSERPVDAVFSTATFHWIADHDRLFTSVHACLRPGGRLVAQCGGAGNLSRFRAYADEVARRAEFAPAFTDFHAGWNYPTAEATSERLTRAGFVDVACSLEDAPTPFADEAAFRAFTRTVVLRAHLARFADEAQREAYFDAVVERAAKAGPFTLDYVRLNIDARRRSTQS
jgi:trans-aconitate methyltransferase